MDNDFKSIEEIINYLENYTGAEHYRPDPPKEIIDGQEVFIMGGLKYDNRVFTIPSFLINNNYIEEQYYNRDKYPEFFDEDFHEYDFENLDIGRVSYLIIRTFNIERIVEGAINNMIKDGYMLRLVKRAKELKENK